jgi:bifunctional DNase/RNase
MNMIRVIVDSIRVSLLTQQRMVMLREVDSRRLLPIWIGAFEAEAIATALQGHEPPRPMTHDLLKNVIAELGGTVQYIAITHLQDTAYHARIVVDIRGAQREIDSRSSDAIALGVRADVPIYVAEAVFDQAGMTSDDENDAEMEQEEQEETPTLPTVRQASPEREEADERDVSEESLSIFRDFINSLENQKPPDENK